MRRLALPLALPVLALVAAGCSSSGSSGPTTLRTDSGGPSQSAGTASTPHAGTALTNWPTYHRTTGRSGVARASISLPLHHGWTANLDGAVYGEPLVVNGTLIVATENDSVYGLNPTTGHRKWRTHLATPESQSNIQHDQPGCGDVFPLGITGTPAYDAATGSVFVVTDSNGGHHKLWALNAATGARRWHKSTDLLPSRDRIAEQQRSALLVADGRVFTTYGGLSGDCGNYVGYITSTATNGKGKTTHYAVPTAREAGMWSPAGPVEGPNHNIYVASGNGAEESGKWDKSDSVTELSPKSLHRISVYAPKTWKQDNIQDLDLGSSSPVPVDGRIVIAGKRGTVYLLHPTFKGVGHAIASLHNCDSYGGAAHDGRTVVMPCRGGVQALRVTKHSLHWLWSSGDYSSPVIAGKRVFVADPDSGDLDVLSLSTGHVVASIGVGSLTHFPSEVIDGKWVYVPTLNGITALHGS
ncbi:MAG TPA: PQQ-binding-like beta-propeller repeat protein [Mycobacteriales bacterium]|nr:PQQ-binding-like beta-propeller repeat protein [Mycobacteriales bacterium]